MTDILKQVLSVYRGYSDLPIELRSEILERLHPTDLHSARLTNKEERKVKPSFMNKPLFEKQLQYNQDHFSPLPVSYRSIQRIRIKLGKLLKNYNDDIAKDDDVAQLWYVVRYLTLRNQMLGQLESRFNEASNFQQGFRIDYPKHEDRSFSLQNENCLRFIESLDFDERFKLDLNIPESKFDRWNSRRRDQQIKSNTLYWNTYLGEGGYYDINREYDFKGSSNGLVRYIGDGTSNERGSQFHTVNPVNIFLLGCNLFEESVVTLYTHDATASLTATETTLEVGEFEAWPTVLSKQVSTDLAVLRIVDIMNEGYSLISEFR